MHTPAVRPSHRHGQQDRTGRTEWAREHSTTRRTRRQVARRNESLRSRDRGVLRYGADLYLNWLPVLIYGIKFKLSALMYRSLATHQPAYLDSLLQFSNIPRLLTAVLYSHNELNPGKRPFSVAAPGIWNEVTIIH